MRSPSLFQLTSSMTYALCLLEFSNKNFGIFQTRKILPEACSLVPFPAFPVEVHLSTSSSCIYFYLKGAKICSHWILESNIPTPVPLSILEPLVGKICGGFFYPFPSCCFIIWPFRHSIDLEVGKSRSRWPNFLPQRLAFSILLLS